jgi:hypothetical protein
VHADRDEERQDGGQERDGDPAEGGVEAEQHAGEEVADRVAERADEEDRGGGDDQVAHQRHEEGADGRPRVLREEALGAPEQQHREDRGEDLRVVVDGRHGQAEQGGAALLRDQRGEAGEQQESDDAEGDRPVHVELLRRRVGDQQREEREDGVGDGRDEAVGVGLRVDPAEGGRQDQQRLEDARARDGGDDRHEDADDEVESDGADALGRPRPLDGSRGRRCGLPRARPQLLHLAVVVAHAPADHDLRLRAADDAEHVRHRLQCGLVDDRVVHEREAQPCRAVLQCCDVAAPADVLEHVLRAGSDIHCHSSLGTSDDSVRAQKKDPTDARALIGSCLHYQSHVRPGSIARPEREQQHLLRWLQSRPARGPGAR